MDKLNNKVVAAIAVVILFSFTTAMAAEKSAIGLHEKADTMKNEECLACHTDILSKQPRAKKSSQIIHKGHLESKLDTPKDCIYCHKFADGKPVPVGEHQQLCHRCH